MSNSLFQTFRSHLPSEVVDLFEDCSGLPPESLKNMLRTLLAHEDNLREIGVADQYIEQVKLAIRKILDPTPELTSPEESTELKAVCKALLENITREEFEAFLFDFDLPKERQLSPFEKPEDQLNALIEYLIETVGYEETLRQVQAKAEQLQKSNSTSNI